MLTPAFHFNILKGFFKIFTEQSEEFVNILQEETENEKTAIIPLIMKHTLRIVCGKVFLNVSSIFMVGFSL